LAQQAAPVSVRVERNLSIAELRRVPAVLGILRASVRVDIHRPGQRQLFHSIEAVVGEQNPLVFAWCGQPQTVPARRFIA
jgi:hypothetical protein